MIITMFCFQGTVLLDLECFDLGSIFESVVENMIITDQLARGNKEKVIDILMSKHRHQHQQSRLKRNFSFSSLSSFTMDAPIATRDKDSGVESALEMEVKKGSVTETDIIVAHKDTKVEDEEMEKNNRAVENSVVFEIGDVDLDEEDKAMEPFIKESHFSDSSDDERVRQRLYS